MGYNQPDKNGYFGKYGGAFVPETLMPCVQELKEAYHRLRDKKRNLTSI